jgi:hypothetical protein
MTKPLRLENQILRDILYGDSDEGETILDTMTGNGRWSIHHRFVFKYKGKLYETTYSEGSTEYQDERPWEDEPVVSCHEVEEYQRTITDYRLKT